MGVADLNKCIVLSDCLNGQVLDILDFDDKDDIVCQIYCSARDVRLFNLIKKSIYNEHGSMFKIGNKN